MPQGKGTYGNKVGRPPKKTTTTKIAMKKKADNRIYGKLKTVYKKK